VVECLDLRELMGLIFDGRSDRIRFEAQRKLLLAQLLLDIEHSRHIQDGPRHKNYFEELLRDSIWRHTRQVHDMEIGYRISDDGQTIEYTSRPSEADQRWRFQSIFLERRGGPESISLDVLYYSCRFKRTVFPVSFEVIDGRHRVLERVRWGEMRHQRSGSILSKMIRSGTSNPDEITDIIGAMFIVHGEEEVADLLTLLDSSIGNPLGWRDVIDTLDEDNGQGELNPYSGKGYRVFKGIVDILIPGQCQDQAPYRFPVEIQIYTLEGYLRTVCSSHEASHQALKKRQFVFGLAPIIFPEAVYGCPWTSPA
jgi:hypothetical protein